MGNVLIPEVLHGRHNGVGCSLTQSAQGSGLNEIADFLQLIQILQSTLTLGNLCQDLQHTAGTNAAGCALAAGFITDELHVELGNVHHAVVLVHDDGTTGTHHGALGYQIVKIDGLIQSFCGQTAAGGAAGLDGLKLLSIGDTAANIIDQFPEGGTHGNLHQTHVVDLAAQGKNLGTLGLLGTAGSK